MTRYFDEATRKEHGVEADTQRLILPGESEEGDFARMFQETALVEEQRQMSPSNNQDEERKGERIETHNESQCNVREEDAFESFSERKAHTNIPLLKNNKNTLNQVSSSVKSFSERLLNGSLKLDVSDINGVANQMIFEINLLAGKMLIL